MTKHEAMLKITRLEGQLAQALTRAETAEAKLTGLQLQNDYLVRELAAPERRLEASTKQATKTRAKKDKAGE